MIRNNSNQLVKARLIPVQGESRSGRITFQFNPKEFSISRSIETAQNGRDRNLFPKMSFKGPNMITVNINDVTFDTYESGQSVRPYITQLLRTMDCSTGGVGGVLGGLSRGLSNSARPASFPMARTPNRMPAKINRPPLFTFVWGENRYLPRCFVKQVDVTYKLFLPNGTPVRATAKITLNQVRTVTAVKKK